MRILSPLKAIALFLIGFTVPATCATPVFVEIKGMNGGSTSAGFENWIEAESLGLDGPIASSAAGGIKITKRIDQATPLLAMAAVTGKPIRLVTIVIRENRDTIAVLNLRDVVIRGMSQDADQTGTDNTEILTLAYRSILFDYPAADGKPVYADLNQGKDTDGDGMTDDYEDYHGFDKTSGDDGKEDSDKDGLTNYTESRLGLNPRSKQSVFRAAGERSPEDPKRFMVSWEAKPGVEYDIYCTTDLSKPFEFLARITAEDFSSAWDAGTEGLKGYYRVVPVLE